MAKPDLPPLTAAEVRALHGRYQDRCGRRFVISAPAPHGFGLYDPATLDAPPLQTDARELRRLISFDSLTRLS